MVFDQWNNPLPILMRKHVVYGLDWHPPSPHCVYQLISGDLVETGPRMTFNDHYAAEFAKYNGCVIVDDSVVYIANEYLFGEIQYAV